MGYLQKYSARRTIVLLTICGMAGLSGCTTVDLSQIAANQTLPVEKNTPETNIVQRTSHALLDICTKKGWSKSRSVKSSQTAASVLMRGIGKEKIPTQTIPDFTVESLVNDITQIRMRVEQTTKAAEVYLVMAKTQHDLDKDLSQLETAFLAVREAQTNIEKTVKNSGNAKATTAYHNFELSVGGLKKVTDDYGDRIRSKITTGGYLN